MRDEERDLIFNEFKDRKGELIKGVVRRFEKGNNLIVDLGRTEGILPFREQTPRETYRPGDRIVAYVKDIDREARGPQVILSRSDPKSRGEALRGGGPGDLRGDRQHRGVRARAGGAARRLPSTSRDADVDPVGACVGMKGSRVQAVVQELRGEKIDIVPYDRDPARFVCAAIQPAEVNKVIVDEADGRMELVVPDEKLSLAIGRKGQNVRLAAQLTGMEARHHQREQVQADGGRGRRALQQIEGVSEAIARSMYRLGFRDARGARRGQRAGARGDPRARRRRGGHGIKVERRDDDGATAPRAHPAPPRRTEPFTERERSSSSAALASAPSSCSKRRAIERSRTSSARTRTSSRSRRVSASRRRGPSSKARSTFFGESKVIEAARREAVAKAREAAAQTS